MVCVSGVSDLAGVVWYVSWGCDLEPVVESA